MQDLHYRLSGTSLQDASKATIPASNRKPLLAPNGRLLFALATYSLVHLLGANHTFAQQPETPRPIYTAPYVVQRLSINQFPLLKDDQGHAHPKQHINLTTVPAPHTVDEAITSLDGRTAAAIVASIASRHNVLDVNAVDAHEEEDYGWIMLAYMAYADYIDDPSNTGLNMRQTVVNSLIRQQPGLVGTSGEDWASKFVLDRGHAEYDVLLTAYITLIYKYYDTLKALPGGAAAIDHVVNDLLTQRGEIDTNQYEVVHDKILGFTTLIVPETENHLLGIEAARYLTNQLLFQKTHDSEYNNATNGTREWILKKMQSLLEGDFIEYNARNYQTYSIPPILNLYSYAYDPAVRIAAQNLLDYYAAKIAVSSSQLRRSAPFRRRNEPEHLGPDLLYADPASGFMAGLAGVTDAVTWPEYVGSEIYGNPPSGYAPALSGVWQRTMVLGGISDYRLPRLILDLFVTKKNRIFYQKLDYHPHEHYRETYSDDYVHEVYASSPSYLICGGGQSAGPAYRAKYLGDAVLAAAAAALLIPFWGEGIAIGILALAVLSDDFDSKDIGAVVRTTFLPTDYGVTNGVNTRQGYPDVPHFEYPYTGLLDSANGLAVAPDFACGGVFIYSEGGLHEGWNFFDKSHGDNSPGYYLAIYWSSVDVVTILEAYDTWVHHGLSFTNFQNNVQASNPASSFTKEGVNSYVTQSGQHIQFTFYPGGKILSTTTDAPTIIERQEGAVTVIHNPMYSGSGNQITLNLADWNNPTRIDESGQVTSAAGIIFLDYSNTRSGQNGQFDFPFSSLAAAAAAVPDLGTIRILSNFGSEAVTIPALGSPAKSFTIIPINGPVTISP